MTVWFAGILAIPMRPFLSPARATLESVRESLAGVLDADAAWSLMIDRGSIPETWRDDPRRRFVHDPGDRNRPDHPTRDPAFAPTGRHPSTVEHCALYASDVDGIRIAEDAAITMAERLAPWGAPPCKRVVWWTLPRWRFDYASTDTRPGGSYALTFAFVALGRSCTQALHMPSSLFGHASRCAEIWRAQAHAGARVPSDVSQPIRHLDGVQFGDLPNPFEPLAAIESVGYSALEYVVGGGASPGSVLLVAPA